MLIQRQLIQHLAAVIRDNKSAPCKRKFRGTFVPARARIAPKFILPRAPPVVIPFFAYFGNERDSASRFFVFPLAIFIGDAASKIRVTIMSCTMTVDKHLTLSGKQSRFRAPIPRWARGRSKHYFHTVDRKLDGFNEVSQLWRPRERQIALFDFATLRFRRRAREVYISELLSPAARMSAQITSVFARLETALVASRRAVAIR